MLVLFNIGFCFGSSSFYEADALVKQIILSLRKLETCCRKIVFSIGKAFHSSLHFLVLLQMHRLNDTKCCRLNLYTLFSACGVSTYSFDET